MLLIQWNAICGMLHLKEWLLSLAMCVVLLLINVNGIIHVYIGVSKLLIELKYQTTKRNIFNKRD